MEFYFPVVSNLGLASAKPLLKALEVSETDTAKRSEIYSKLIDRAMELSPFEYLTWREQSYGMKANVEEFKI